MAAAILTPALGNLAVASAVAAAAAVVGRRGWSPALAHALWLLVLVKLVTPPLLPVALPCLPADALTTSAGWGWWVFGVWLAGAAAYAWVAGRRLRRFAALLRLAPAAPRELRDEVSAVAGRLGLPRVPRVRVLPGGVAPLVWAVGPATVYLPAGLLVRVSAGQRATLLAHELTHLRRRDHFVRWVEFAVVVLY